MKNTILILVLVSSTTVFAQNVPTALPGSEASASRLDTREPNRATERAKERTVERAPRYRQQRMESTRTRTKTNTKTETEHRIIVTPM